jgi:hypothetical protein
MNFSPPDENRILIAYYTVLTFYVKRETSNVKRQTSSFDRFTFVRRGL